MAHSLKNGRDELSEHTDLMFAMKRRAAVESSRRHILFCTFSGAASQVAGAYRSEVAEV